MAEPKPAVSLSKADPRAAEPLGAQATFIHVNTHTEREQLYLMLSSNSCQVEMALCNHGDTQYNLVSSD